MTATDKDNIRQLRGDGLGYKAIASKLELPVASVKGFCQRSGLSASADSGASAACLQCGKPLGERLPGAERKKFCSDACRNKWWSAKREPKEQDRRVCAYCRRVFFDRKPRKYCGVPCSTAARFGGERHDARAV
jgi:hypothetical protein